MMSKKSDDTPRKDSEGSKPHHDRGILADLGQAAAAGLTAAGKIVEATGKGASALGEAAGGAVNKHEAKKQQTDD